MKRRGLQRLTIAALVLGFGVAFLYCKLRLVSGMPRTALAAPGAEPAAPPPRGAAPDR